MKEPYGEGLASHTDPESCVASRKAGREALTGAHVGGVLSREISGNQDADAVYSAGRRPTKENTRQTAASQMQSWGDALAGLQRVREAAKRDKRLRFTALLHHVSVVLLTNSFYALKREAAPGVDGVTWQEYETDLDKRLEDLHSRVHRGTYRALPSKRAYIPKSDGRQRPLGIAALEGSLNCCW